VLRSYPGVAYSPIGYRNDLIVRGGSPAENGFYIDGIEIPNINHFSTQGASGGPVGIINADLIEQVQFYTGALPVDMGGVLSSVMDIRMKSGDPYKHTFKARIGASEVGLSGSGHFGSNTTYIFSLRQSYLQFLFKLLGLPFLPNYIDGQINVKHRITPKDEILFLFLGGVDRMKLNTDEKGEEVEYLLSYLPVVKQNTFTTGVSYTHYGNNNRFNLSLNYNYFDNSNIKYRNNDSSAEENLILDIGAVEQKIGFRAEERLFWGRWKLLAGIYGAYNSYMIDSFRKEYIPEIVADEATSLISNTYKTALDYFSFAPYISFSYESYNKRFNAKAGVRADGATCSAKLLKFWRSVSPRMQLSFLVLPQLSLNANIGIYHQLPPYTALGYKENGEYVNGDLGYMRVFESTLGARWNVADSLVISLEGFYKLYENMPLSVTDRIPLACKGNDYGIVGNEALVSQAEGRAYGVELSARWQLAGRVNLVGSATLYSSQYRRGAGESYLPSAWDNRYIVNCAATYEFWRNWSAGAKISCIGGAPYTPYDIEKSSLKEAWDAQGKPYPDYTRFNSMRLQPFAQLDIRADKIFYFRNWQLGVYIDLQNITGSRLKQQDVLMSTGVIENPQSPASTQRYVMKYISQETGSIVPTLGVTVEF
ncbi:MAG: TonB-dependent receptor plug domain-containing protein, partial [Bacteroidales bacterium]|nr:TonB-dependent receptor plug domain-containing protein [Bacteroidales bacterium]